MTGNSKSGRKVNAKSARQNGFVALNAMVHPDTKELFRSYCEYNGLYYSFAADKAIRSFLIQDAEKGEA